MLKKFSLYAVVVTMALALAGCSGDSSSSSFDDPGDGVVSIYATAQDGNLLTPLAAVEPGDRVEVTFDTLRIFDTASQAVDLTDQGVATVDLLAPAEELVGAYSIPAGDYGAAEFAVSQDVTIYDAANDRTCSAPLPGDWSETRKIGVPTPPGFLTIDESGGASFTVVMPIDDVFCPASGPGTIDTGGSLRVVPSL